MFTWGLSRLNTVDINLDWPHAETPHTDDRHGAEIGGEPPPMEKLTGGLLVISTIGVEVMKGGIVVVEGEQKECTHSP